MDCQAFRDEIATRQISGNANQQERISDFGNTPLRCTSPDVPFEMLLEPKDHSILFQKNPWK
jgi:hypothetical protein